MRSSKRRQPSAVLHVGFYHRDGRRLMTVAYVIWPDFGLEKVPVALCL